MAQTLALDSDCTIFNATLVRDQLLAALATDTEVEVDLSQVSDLDSAGVQLLIAAKREASAANKTLRFVNHSQNVVEALDLLDLVAHLGDPVLLHSRT